MQISIAQAQLFFLALTRIMSILIHVPVLGGRIIPNPIKIGLGITLTIIMLPWEPLPPDAVQMPWMGFAVGIGKELLIGTLVGFAAVLTFNVIQIAGQMMGLGSGFAAAQILNPAMEDTGTPLSQVLTMTALLIFLVINGHHDFIKGLQGTFALVPVNGDLPETGMNTLIALTGGMISTGIHMSLPVFGTVLLTDLTFGLVARVAPQIHVFFLGIPLKIIVGLLALSMGLSILMPTLRDLFHSLGLRGLQLLGA